MTINNRLPTSEEVRQSIDNGEIIAVYNTNENKKMKTENEIMELVFLIRQNKLNIRKVDKVYNILYYPKNNCNYYGFQIIIDNKEESEWDEFYDNKNLWYPKNLNREFELENFFKIKEEVISKQIEYKNFFGKLKHKDKLFYKVSFKLLNGFTKKDVINAIKINENISKNLETIKKAQALLSYKEEFEKFQNEYENLKKQQNGNI